MVSNIAQVNAPCPAGEISAYIDGELSPAEEMSLELHLAGCPSCVSDLNDQKQFLRALDMSLVDTGELKLPKNFTKTVVATAESRVNGLRRRSEIRNALLICSGLFLISIFAVGRDLPMLMSTLSAIVEKFVVVAGFVGHFLFSVAFGLSVVARSLASQVVFGSAFRMGLFVVIFAFAILGFSRLLNRDRRA